MARFTTVVACLAMNWLGAVLAQMAILSAVVAYRRSGLGTDTGLDLKVSIGQGLGRVCGHRKIFDWEMEVKYGKRT